MSTKNLLTFITMILLAFGLMLESTLASSEFLVNTQTSGNQGTWYNGQVAINSSGDFIIAWYSYPQDGSGNGIYAQRYNNDGTKNGSEFQVNSYINSDQVCPSLAIDDSCNFVVTWQSNGQDGSGYGIYAQRFDSGGNKVGSEFRVNTYTTSDQIWSAVAMNGVGDFIISWSSNGQDGSSYGVYAQRYNNDGTKNGSEFLVNSYTNNIQWDSFIVLQDNGKFLITWTSLQDGSGFGVYGQLFNNDGTKNGSEFRINTQTNNPQEGTSVGMDSYGNFAVTWTSSLQDGSTYGVFAQRFDKDANLIGSEFQVNTFTSGAQFHSYLAMDDSGDFIITWESDGQDGSGFGIFAQKYNNDGTKNGTEYQVNSYTNDSQQWSSVAMNGTGNYVIVWMSNNQVDTNSGWDVYAKHYITEQEDAITLETFNAEAEGSKIILTWTTGTEIDNLGFYIVRSESTDSGYMLLNEEIILAKGDAYSGYTYCYVDTHVNPGHVYYYWLADLDVHCEYTIHGPVKVVTDIRGN